MVMLLLCANDAAGCGSNPWLCWHQNTNRVRHPNRLRQDHAHAAQSRRSGKKAEAFSLHRMVKPLHCTALRCTTLRCTPLRTGRCIAHGGFTITHGEFTRRVRHARYVTHPVLSSTACATLHCKTDGAAYCPHRMHCCTGRTTVSLVMLRATLRPHRS